MSTPPNSELDEFAEDNRFVYTAKEELPSLQEMASWQVAFTIWNGYVSRCSINKWNKNTYEFPRPTFVELLGLYSTFREDTNSLVESLKTPPSIETILKTSLAKAREEMRYGVLVFIYQILFNLYPDIKRITVFKQNWCVWLPNGEIDYLKTAESMVSPENNELNSKIKFAIMCEFYMEENLKKFPLNSLPADFIKQLFDIHYIIPTRHWIRYLTGKCEEINAYGMVADCVLLDGIGGIRITHFWHRLSDDDQVKAVYNMLVKRSGIHQAKWKTVEPVLGSMSWDQQKRLLSMPRACEKIIISSCGYSSSSKCAVWAWKHCREFTTAEEFFNIIREIFYFTTDRGYRENDFYSTLLELWDTAYDHHRNFLATHGTFSFYSSLLHYRDSDHYSSATYTLLNKFLALKPSNEKKALIMKFAAKLATGTLDPYHIQEILDLNLPHPDDQTEFKKFLMNSGEMKGHCAEFWVNGNFDIMNRSIKFYCDGDVNSIRQYNQNLLSEIVTSKHWCRYADKSIITNSDKWQKCCKFIDEILPDDPAEALVTKQQLVLQLLKYEGQSKRLCIHFDLAIKTIESVFPVDAELKRVKTEFIKAHPAPDGELFCERADFCDDVYFHSMIEWCCENNEEAVAELKSKIPEHDTIFDIVFFQLNKVYVTEATGLKMSLLTRLDKYLSWYLASKDEIMNYKMSRLNESVNLPMFATICKHRDENSLKMLLEWFFDDDQAKVRDYRSKKMKV